MTSRFEIVVDALLAAGYEAAGATPTERVKFCVSTGSGMGFKGATFGGRARFARGAERATVGKITTCFYEVHGRESTGFVNVPTKDVDQIKFLARNPEENLMLNIESRDWVENALDFWLNVEPDPRHGRTRNLIAWNVEQLSLALERLPCSVCDGDGATSA